MAGRLFGESIRSRSRQSSRSSFRILGNGKSSDFGIGSGEVTATWYFNADAPADGETTMRGRLLLQQENNKSEEVTVTLQNGMLHIQRSAANAGKNARPTAIALQDAIINQTPKLGIYAGIQITIPSRDLEFSFLTESEEERDEWVSALRFNSLAHIRLRIQELTSLQGQTEADLRESRRRADETNQQAKDFKNEFTALKASLEHDKARLVEAYESMREKQENTEAALRATKRELDAAKKELNNTKDETSAQIQDTRTKLNDDLRRTRSSYDAKIERLSREVAERDNQLHNLSGDLQSAHSERHQADQTVASMNREIRALKQKCGELQGQLDDTITKLRLSNEKREELQNNIIAAQAASERAHQKLAALSTEVKEQKSGRQVLEREVTGRRGQLSTMQQQSRDLQRQVANLKGQLQVQRQESERHVKGLKETIQTKDGDLHKLHRANVELEAKYEVLRAELRDKTARLKGIQKGGNEPRLNSRMSSLRPEFAQTLVSQYSGMSDPQRLELEAQLAAAQRKIQSLEENAIIAEQAQVRINQEREEAIKLQQRLQEMEGELEQQQKQLQQADQQIVILSQQNAQIESLKESAQRSQEEVVKLQQQLQEFHADSALLEESKKRESELLDKLASFENRAAEFNNQMHNLENELMQTRHQCNNLQKDKEDLLFKAEELEREFMDVQSRFYEAQDDAQRLQDQLILERKSIQVESQSLNRQRHNIVVALKALLSNVQANSQAFDSNQSPVIAPPHTSDPLPLIHLVEQVVGEIVAQRDNIQRELIAIESQNQQEHLKSVPSPIRIDAASPATLQEAAQALNSPGFDQSPTALSASPRISGLRRAASEVNQRTIEREISLKMYIDLPKLQQQQPNLSLPTNNTHSPQAILEEGEEELETEEQVTSYTGSKQEQNHQDMEQIQRSGIVLEHSSNNNSDTAIVQERQIVSEVKKGGGGGGSEGEIENKVIIPPTMRDLQDKLNQLAHQQAALEDELYRNSSVQKDLQIKLKELRSVKKDSLSEEESRRLEKELTSIQEALEFTKDSVKKLESKIYERQLSAQSLGRRMKGGEGGDIEREGGDGSGVGEKSRTPSRSLSIELADAEAEALKLKEMEQSAAKTAHELEQLRKQLQEKDDILSDMHTRETELLSEVTQLNQKLSKQQNTVESVGKQVVDDADSTRDARILDPSEEPQHKTQLLASYRRELGLRRQLHNMVLDLKGSIRVMTRLNPLQPGEQQGQLKLTFPESNVDPSFPTTVLQVDSEHDAEQLSRKYEFDRVFQAEEGTERVYQEMEGVLASVLEGYKVCLVCYGHNAIHSAAAAGATEDTTTRGIMWRTIQALFREGQSMPETEMKVSLSMVEVGPGGSLSDLLAANPHAPINNQIISNKKQSLVSQFTRAGVDNAEKAQQALHAGFSQRNCTGGGSNLLYVVDVETLNLQTNVKCLGKLYIADLVGTDGQDALGSLEVIITSLVMRSNHFLAGRRTPLTKLLYEAMGGNARVLLLTSISPAQGRESATMATLKFALRAMAAELGPAVPIKKLPGAPTPSSHRMSPVYPYSSSNETQTEN